jgi:peptidoglycan/xylan/chitin deacetylase (PgdA/CDA1 family)
MARPARTATAAACALLATGGLAACHGHSAAHQRVAGGASTPSQTSSTPTTRPRRPAPTLTKPAGTTPSPSPSRSRSPRRSHERESLPPVISHIPVHGKLVFITIDDGWEKDPDFVKLIQKRRIPVTLFLENLAIRKNYGYFRELQQAGALIEDHTMTHPYMPGLSYAQQKRQICQTADIYAREFGSRPTLFRAPYGATRRDTLRAARDCGMKAVFFWREVVSNGRIAYQVPGRLHPGDILLVHFNPNMTADFKHMLHTIEKQGFTPAAFKDHLPASYFQR